MHSFGSANILVLHASIVKVTSVFLCCRQATGATVAVYNSIADETWMFMKEISSDGDVSTVRRAN